MRRSTLCTARIADSSPNLPQRGVSGRAASSPSQDRHWMSCHPALRIAASARTIFSFSARSTQTPTDTGSRKACEILGARRAG